MNTVFFVVIIVTLAIFLNHHLLCFFAWLFSRIKKKTIGKIEEFYCAIVIISFVISIIGYFITKQ